MPPGSVYSFGDFALDGPTRLLTHAGQRVPIAERHIDVLLHLVAHAGVVVSKNALIDTAWRDVAVTDNSLEQAVSALRRALGARQDGEPYIQTVPRQGYRFMGVVTQTTARVSDQALDSLLAPYRAWIEGRAAIETLERDQIVHARDVFERVLIDMPGQAPAHVGLANASILQFETTRADDVRDTAALAAAVHHAREACRLDAGSAEAWATLGFVLDRTGAATDALAAVRRAVTLEPDNWRHHLRHAYVSWGEERLRAAQRVLALLPGFPIAHWLAATVHVARQALDEAARELDAGIAGETTAATGRARFSAVALHWLRGLVHLARGDEDRGLAELERELSFEAAGHLYARECCANTFYAIGAVFLRQARLAEARAAFEHAVERIDVHPLARLGLAAIDGTERADTQGREPLEERSALSVDVAMCRAAGFVLAGARADAARLMDKALAQAAPGNAGWLLPVEPLLRTVDDPATWAPALARLRTRAA